MDEHKQVNIVSALDLARKFNINKSAVLFYVREGILTPAGTVGTMYIFDKDVAEQQIKVHLDKKKR